MKTRKFWVHNFVVLPNSTKDGLEVYINLENGDTNMDTLVFSPELAKQLSRILARDSKKILEANSAKSKAKEE